MMTTVGEILKNKRLEKKLSLLEVEKATKIRQKFLVALEEGDYKSLPPPTFIRGFIQNYASYLGLPVSEALAFYRRELSTEKAPVLPRRVEKFPTKFVLTPRILMILGGAAILAVFFAYLLGQYLIFTGAPYLTVDSPKDYSVVTSSPVAVSGRTDPTASLSINNQPVTVSEGGSFRVDVPLSPGLNTLTIAAKNKFNKESQIVRQIRLEGP